MKVLAKHPLLVWPVSDARCNNLLCYDLYQFTCFKYCVHY